jgi:UDP-2,4-diacetamido-2,4,6-trideoxy-beta-L-altropyranose hydrolase
VIVAIVQACIGSTRLPEKVLSDLGEATLNRNRSARMTQQAVFRCDAGRSIGTGHLVRCLALAEALTERGWACRFLSLPGSRAAVARFAHFPAEILEAHAVDDAGAVRALVPKGCDLFVLDSYRLGIHHEIALRGWYGSCLVLDDRPFRRHEADVLLDPTLGREPGAYAPLVARDTTLLLGPSYALLRPAFRDARPRALARRMLAGAPQKILVALGGGCGARPVLDVILEACRRSALVAELHIVAPESRELPAHTGAMRIVRHGLTADLHRLASACDLAIGAGGGSAWERCCLGLPTITVQVADNQSDIAAALAGAGAAVDLGPARSLASDALARSLRDLAGDPARRHDMAMRAALICDGLGARRVAGVLSPWLARDGEPVALRPATRADAQLLFRWQQIPEVRRHTPNPDPPSWDEHLTWLEGRLADVTAGPFSIIVKGNRDAGVLRLDRCSRELQGYRTEPNALRLSICLEPGSRGMGVAAAALQAARFLIAQSPFYAEDRPAHAASQRLFTRAGYREVAEGLYRQAPEAGPWSDSSEYLLRQAHAR